MSEGQVFAEPVVAWRAWLIGSTSRESVNLLSVTGTGYPASKKSRDTYSYRMPTRAFCRQVKEHESPVDSCDCGIYGAASFFEAWRWVDWAQVSVDDGWRNNLACVGLVSLWGEVVEYSSGYRAEFAYPKELWIPPCSWATEQSREFAADFLADAYGVPCSLIDSYKEIPGYHRFLAGQHVVLPESVVEELTARGS